MVLSLFPSLFVFVFGLIIGSFLNCLIYRLQIKEGFLISRSYCPNCKHVLGWQDLIPIFSFIVLRGKCRYCQTPISWQYPLVEFATGALFLLIVDELRSFSPFAIAWVSKFAGIESVYFLYLLIISCFLIIVFVFDFKHFIIPDGVIYPAILLSGIWYLVSGIFLNFYTKYEILNITYSAFGAAAFFLTIVLISRGKWMGFGDVKLAFFMGLFLGFPDILVALFLAFFIGAIIGIGLIILKKKTLKSELPFGPFLVTGTFIALFWGEKIINWYLSLIL